MKHRLLDLLTWLSLLLFVGATPGRCPRCGDPVAAGLEVTDARTIA